MTKDLASDIADTSHDYSKLINAKGTHDWLGDHLGVSGGFAAKVGSMVLDYGYTKLKEHMARRYQESLMLPRKPPKSFGAKGDDGNDVEAESVTSLTPDEAATMVHDITCEAWRALGCSEAELPSLEDIKAFIKAHHTVATNE